MSSNDNNKTSNTDRAKNEKTNETLEKHYKDFRYGCFGDEENMVTDPLNRLLIEASGSGEVVLIPLLVEKGADINYHNGSPLGSAIREDFALAAKLLIELGAEVNGEEGSYTLLHQAAEDGHTEAIVILLGAGADINARYKGSRPIDLVRNNEWDGGVKYLLEQAERGIRPTPESVGLKLPLKKKSMLDHASNKTNTRREGH